MRRLLLLPSFWILSYSLIYATSFSPVTIKTQIQQSDSIIHGKVSSIEYQDVDDIKATKVELILDHWLGDDFPEQSAEVYFPGADDFIVQGSPKLNEGERVVLFLTKVDGRFWISNLGLGKFSIKRAGNKKVLVNQIFPQIPEVGQIELDNFIRLVKRLKKKKFHRRFKDKYEISLEKNMKKQDKEASRSIASYSQDENSENKEKSNVIWLIILLAALSFTARTLRSKMS